MVTSPTPLAAGAEPVVDGLPPRIVFFDGECVFCNNTVRWLIPRDPEGRLRFAPLGGTTAAALRSAHPRDFPGHENTIVYAELSTPRPCFLLRSRAAFAVLETLGPLPWYLRVLRALPAWLSDLGYRAFARLRHRIFGRLDTCPVPSPDLRARFLP